MLASWLLHISLLAGQITGPETLAAETPPALKAAPARIFKDLGASDPSEAERKPVAKSVLVSQFGNNPSSRRPRSGYVVNGNEAGPPPAETGPITEGPVANTVIPQEEATAIQPETLGDREDPAWRGALTAPPSQLPANPRRIPQNNYGPPQQAAPGNYSQLSHNVRPQQPAQIVNTVAYHLVNRWFEPAREEHTSRNELSLLDALEGTSDPGDRTRVVVAYWQAAGEAAEERLARDEVNWLKMFDAASGGSHLQAAKHGAEAELQSAQLRRDEASETLARLVHRAGTDRYPLAIDLPCVEAYRTHADNLLAGRPDADEMKQITRKLPTMLNVVVARAGAVEAMESIQKQMAERHAQATPADVLNAFQELRFQRRKFVAAVVAYNTSIAKYAFGAADRGLQPSRAVAMLIARPRQTARAPGNSRASYEPAQIAAPVSGEMEDPVYLR